MSLDGLVNCMPLLQYRRKSAAGREKNLASSSLVQLLEKANLQHIFPCQSIHCFSLLNGFLHSRTQEKFCCRERKNLASSSLVSVAGESRSSFPPFSTVYFQMVHLYQSLYQSYLFIVSSVALQQSLVFNKYFKKVNKNLFAQFFS